MANSTSTQLPSSMIVRPASRAAWLAWSSSAPGCIQIFLTPAAIACWMTWSVTCGRVTNTILRNWKSRDRTDAGSPLPECYAHLGRREWQLALQRNRLLEAKNKAIRFHTRFPLSSNVNGEREYGLQEWFPMRTSHALRSAHRFAEASIDQPQSIAIPD